jgi:hypothetical protein
MSFTCHSFDVMKGEKKQTFTYATKPSVRIKAAKKAAKEGLSLSEKIDELLNSYIKHDSIYFDSMGSFLMQENKRK